MGAVGFNGNSLEKGDSSGCRGGGVAVGIFTIIFLVLSGNDHSLKVSSNSEMGPGQLFLVLSENWC